MLFTALIDILCLSLYYFTVTACMHHDKRIIKTKSRPNGLPHNLFYCPDRTKPVCPVRTPPPACAGIYLLPNQIKSQKAINRKNTRPKISTMRSPALTAAKRYIRISSSLMPCPRPEPSPGRDSLPPLRYQGIPSMFISAIVLPSSPSGSLLSFLLPPRLILIVMALIKPVDFIKNGGANKLYEVAPPCYPLLKRANPMQNSAAAFTALPYPQ